MESTKLVAKFVKNEFDYFIILLKIVNKMKDIWNFDSTMSL